MKYKVVVGDFAFSRNGKSNYMCTINGENGYVQFGRRNNRVVGLSILRGNTIESIESIDVDQNEIEIEQ